MLLILAIASVHAEDWWEQRKSDRWDTINTWDTYAQSDLPPIERIDSMSTEPPAGQDLPMITVPTLGLNRSVPILSPWEDPNKAVNRLRMINGLLEDATSDAGVNPKYMEKVPVMEKHYQRGGPIIAGGALPYIEAGVIGPDGKPLMKIVYKKGAMYDGTWYQNDNWNACYWCDLWHQIRVLHTYRQCVIGADPGTAAWGRDQSTLERIGRFIEIEPIAHEPLKDLGLFNSLMFGGTWPGKDGTLFEDFPDDDKSYVDSNKILEVKKNASEYKLKSATAWKFPLGMETQEKAIHWLEQIVPYLQYLPLVNWMSPAGWLAAFLARNDRLEKCNKLFTHWFMIFTFERDGQEIYVKAQRNNDGIRMECVTSADAPLQDKTWPTTKCETYVDRPAQENRTLADLLTLCESQAKTALPYNMWFRNCHHMCKFFHKYMCTGPMIEVPMDTDPW